MKREFASSVWIERTGLAARCGSDAQAAFPLAGSAKLLAPMWMSIGSSRSDRAS